MSMPPSAEVRNLTCPLSSKWRKIAQCSLDQRWPTPCHRDATVQSPQSTHSRKVTTVTQHGTEVFSQVSGHEQVVFCTDRRSGLRAVIAVHSTARGPALGGTRFHAY